MNRTNPYAADATGRSTGDTIITAWVVSVLLMPMKMPAMITAVTSTTRVSGQIAMTARSIAKSVSATYSDGPVPYRACKRGAPATEKIATSRPQPKKTKPS